MSPGKSLTTAYVPNSRKKDIHTRDIIKLPKIVIVSELSKVVVNKFVNSDNISIIFQPTFSI